MDTEQAKLLIETLAGIKLQLMFIFFTLCFMAGTNLARK
jgi:hypothetical protein